MVRINESEFPLKNGEFGKIAIFLYSGTGDPKVHLGEAISKYTEVVNGYEIKYIELIDAYLDNPWMRVVISGVNDMNQFEFEPNKHRMVNVSDERNTKINELGI